MKSVILYREAVYKEAGKYGAKVLVSDVDKLITDAKSLISETKSSQNPQVVLTRAKAEARLEVLEALLSDSAWNLYKSIR